MGAISTFLAPLLTTAQRARHIVCLRTEIMDSAPAQGCRRGASVDGALSARPARGTEV